LLDKKFDRIFCKMKCYEPRANRYYSSRIALHKVIRKGRFVDRIKMIKMAWPLSILDFGSRWSRWSRPWTSWTPWTLDDGRVYSFRTRLPYGSCSTHLKSLLIVTLVHWTICESSLNIRLPIAATPVTKWLLALPEDAYKPLQ